MWHAQWMMKMRSILIPQWNRPCFVRLQEYCKGMCSYSDHHTVRALGSNTKTAQSNVFTLDVKGSPLKEGVGGGWKSDCPTVLLLARLFGVKVQTAIGWPYRKHCSWLGKPAWVSMSCGFHLIFSVPSSPPLLTQKTTFGNSGASH